MSAVLKMRHSLLGKNLIPLIVEVRSAQVPPFWNRLKKEHPLEKYSPEELSSEFKRLSGETAEEILIMAGKSDPQHEDFLVLMHCAIAYANSVGAPKGSPLQELHVNETPTGRVEAPKSPGTKKADKAGNVEQRVETMEKELGNLRKTQGLDKVEESLKQDEASVKRFRFLPEIPSWELEINFDPKGVNVPNIDCWVNYKGENLQPPFMFTNAETVAEGGNYDFSSLPFRDPMSFRAGNLHRCLDQWRLICDNEDVLDWVENGVQVEKYFKHFKGNFKGKSYNSHIPPACFFSNARVCCDHVEFISKTLISRLKQGSISLWGKVGECDPPHLVMPLTVEPTKPRLCHDERYLNLWIIDKPFVLETLKDVPRVIDKNAFMCSVDDKSGYDHIRLNDSSRKYFGIQFGGYYFVYNSIPFGFKTSAYIYQTVGLVATGYCRQLGVPCLQYIDDRLISELHVKSRDTRFEQGRARALRSLYVVCQVLTRLGYFLGLAKCSFEPEQCKLFLGFLICSVRRAFEVPFDKKQNFAILREHMIESKFVDLKTLQRFAGKCISFMLAVPAAKLYIREVNACISQATKNSKPVQMFDGLKSELLHWRFIDDWEGHVPWRVEKHHQVTVHTDASLFKWGAVVGEDKVALGDFFDRDDVRPIHLKEADAVLKTVTSYAVDFENHRVDAYVDNKSVVCAWEGQGCRCLELTWYIKELFKLVQCRNIHLVMHYIHSSENLADEESRRLSLKDCTLSDRSWSRLEAIFGPHTVDLMALDSNAMKASDGSPLRHFTPFKTPKSAGVNVFAQDLSGEVEYGVPRVWKPADLCATCKYPNDQGFRFCQACGLKGGLESSPITVDAATRERLSHLDNLLSSSSYSKKKSALQKEFSNFLYSRSQVRYLECTHPSDICEFLVFKDRVGKTQIHEVSCGNLGKVGNFPCACPKGLSWGYVQSLVGQLKAIFESMGKGKLWDEVTMKGNPCSSLKVQRYVKAVKLEQSLAHVPVKQAKPLFFDKLQRIGYYISSRLKSGGLSVVKRFVFLRDQAFFKLQFFAGDRAGDLGKLISQEIKRLDDDSGFVFAHTVGKTLGNGKTNEFVVLRLDDGVVCPIKGLELYVKSAGAMGIDVKKGFLFRPLDIHGKRVLNQNVTSSTMYYRLRFYLSELGVYEGETLHSIRGGCAVTLALSGFGSSEQIMDHVGWATTRSFQRYSRLGRITDSSSVASLFKHVAQTPENVQSLYANYGSSNNLVNAFE